MSEPSPTSTPRRPHRLAAGTEEARRVASAGGRASAAANARRRWDARIAELIEAAPELTPAQRDRIAAVFGGAVR